ncbi:thymidine kinase [Patescibacteria group bacterium]
MLYSPRIQKPGSFAGQRGFSVVIVGPVGSGKTTELFRQLERVEIAGGKVALFKPHHDTRDEGVRTHGGFERKAISIKDPEEIFDYLENDITAIGIEEAQFLDNKICGVIRVLVLRGFQVIVVGLNLDFMARPFGPVPVLMAQAEYVVKLQAVCMNCGEDASRTRRKTDAKEQVLVGGLDIYEPLCTACHERWLSGSSQDEL